MMFFSGGDEGVVVNNDTDDSWTTKSSSSGGSRNSPLEAVLQGSNNQPDLTNTQTPIEELQGEVRPAVVDDIFSQAGDSPFMTFDTGVSKSKHREQDDNQDSQEYKSDAIGLSDIVKSVSNGVSSLTVQSSEEKVNGDSIPSESTGDAIGSEEQEDDLDGGIKEHGMTEQEMVDC